MMKSCKYHIDTDLRLSNINEIKQLITFKLEDFVLINGGIIKSISFERTNMETKIRIVGICEYEASDIINPEGILNEI